ncbi:MAG: hypothetical protein QNJ70_09365 [Xenococcaceae cyanobacterium MO_207.B15]|nr:hypothetical protein [Xenococcaceae cyanobacterium MO_207.B15]
MVVLINLATCLIVSILNKRAIALTQFKLYLLPAYDGNYSEVRSP